MIVRCKASTLVVRGTPGGVDLGQRLKKGDTATAVGQSFDGGWYYVTNAAVTGWVARSYLVEVAPTTVPLRIRWMGAAAANYRFGRANGSIPDMIVIHVIEGTLKSCDAWFNNATAGVSAHYGIGLKRELHQYVSEDHTAFHAGRIARPSAPLVLQRRKINPNDYSIGIEHEGWRETEWPDTMYEDSARLVSDIARRMNIPLDRTHVVGHREIFADKACPGKGDVDRIVTMARDLAL